MECSENNSHFYLIAHSLLYNGYLVSFPAVKFCRIISRRRVIEGKIKGEMEVTKRRGRRRNKLLDDLKDRRGYSHLKEEALDRTMWRNRFGGGIEPVVRQNTE
jgi:hypothetical protein